MSMKKMSITKTTIRKEAVIKRTMEKKSMRKKSGPISGGITVVININFIGARIILTTGVCSHLRNRRRMRRISPSLIVSKLGELASAPPQLRR